MGMEEEDDDEDGVGVPNRLCYTMCSKVHAEHEDDGRGFERELVEEDLHLLEHRADVALRIHLLHTTQHNTRVEYIQILIHRTRPPEPGNRKEALHLLVFFYVIHSYCSESGVQPRACPSACSTG